MIEFLFKNGCYWLQFIQCYYIINLLQLATAYNITYNNY